MTATLRTSTPPASEPAPPASQAWVSNRILAPVTALLLVASMVCAIVHVSGGTVPMSVQLVPFAISIVVFGLPHGALDHLVPARLRPGTSVLRSVLTVVALYLVLGTATAALWTVAPLSGIATFIAITWFHWGQGDLFVDRLLADGTADRVGATITVALRGALPMLVPFVAQPGAAMTVVTGIVTSLHAGTGAVLSVPTPVRIGVGVLVAALVLLHLTAVHRSGSSIRRQGTEDIVLVVFFAVVPPVLAVGLYFTLWHSVRHILRLELTDSTSAADLHRGRLLAPFLRFMRQAWPITLIAVVMLIALALTLHRADLGIYLALIAALTTPHAVIVTWMDHVQHTWRRADADRTES